MHSAREPCNWARCDLRRRVLTPAVYRLARAIALTRTSFFLSRVFRTMSPDMMRGRVTAMRRLGLYFFWAKLTVPMVVPPTLSRARPYLGPEGAMIHTCRTPVAPLTVIVAFFLRVVKAFLR